MNNINIGRSFQVIIRERTKPTFGYQCDFHSSDMRNEIHTKLWLNLSRNINDMIVRDICDKL